LTIFRTTYVVNIADYILAFSIATLIDLDHWPVLKKFGFMKVTFAEKRLIQPLHNFFFLSFFSILSAFFTLFVAKELGILVFVIVAHMIWDIFEDVLIFRTSFRRWEKTWGLNTEDLERTYNELLYAEATEPKKESKIRKIAKKMKEKGGEIRLRRKRFREKFRRRKKLESIKKQVETINIEA